MLLDIKNIEVLKKPKATDVEKDVDGDYLGV